MQKELDKVWAALLCAHIPSSMGVSFCQESEPESVWRNDERYLKESHIVTANAIGDLLDNGSAIHRDISQAR